MDWKFGEREKTNHGEVRLPGPKRIPDAVPPCNQRKHKDYSWVWGLKGAIRPTEKKNVLNCRVFDEAKATQAGVKVRDWNSLDEHLDLILWEAASIKEHKQRALRSL